MAPKAKTKPKSAPPSAQTQPQPQPQAQLQPSATAIEDLFSILDKHIKAADYKQIIKVADQILGIAPGDEDALQCKVVALIQADDVNQALSVIQASEKLPGSLKFHEAYCLYRRNRLDEALESLKGLERNSSVLQLEAQILYRKGAMDVCIESYEKLIQKFKIDSIELKTNIVAAFISGGRFDEISTLMAAMKVTPNSSFELAYNTACALIEKRNYTEAQELLLLARRIGQEMLIEEEYTDEEIENELAPISVQLAYVQQVLGASGDAMGNYNNILKQRLADAPSIAVATNNLIALKGAKDVFDGLKKFDKLIEKSGGGRGVQLANGLEYKLSARQKEAIYCNRLLLLLHANKLDQVRELVPALLDMFPNSVTPTLIQASLLVRENKSHRAEEILAQFAGHPNNSTLALLMRAQVATAAGHHMVAVESLGQISEIRHWPSTVATLVSLRERAGDVDGAESVFDAAIEWWSNNMGEDQHILELIMRQAASFKLEHKKVKAAGDLFEQLVHNSSPTVRAEALNGLVSTTVYTDLEKAEIYEKQLPPLPGLSSVDVKALEQTSGAHPTTSTGKHLRAAEDANRRSEVGDDKQKARLKKKRKRKPRYPKGFDPANPGPPPDPERWLPKRERSTYRPKRKDRRAAQIRGSQGSVVREKGVDHAANGPSSSKSGHASSNVGKATGSHATSEAPRSSLAGAQKSKKKVRR